MGLRAENQELHVENVESEDLLDSPVRRVCQAGNHVHKPAYGGTSELGAPPRKTAGVVRLSLFTRTQIALHVP